MNISPLSKSPLLEEEQSTNGKKKTSREQTESRLHFREERQAVADMIAEYLRLPAEISKRFEALLPGEHFGPWETFWPFLQQLMHMKVATKGLIILGGWRRCIPPEDISKVPVPPAEFLNLLEQYYCYDRTLFLYGKVYRSAKGRTETEIEAPADIFVKWVNTHEQLFFPDPFESLGSSGIHAHASHMREHFLNLIKSFLHGSQDRAFLFYPDSTDPASGWKDFFKFAKHYNSLPREFINSFGNHYMIVQIPSP
jgi:hypothetical protein